MHVGVPVGGLRLTQAGCGWPWRRPVRHRRRDVELKSINSRFRPLAVLGRAATRVERRDDRTGDLLERRRGERHVRRTAGRWLPERELGLDRRQ